MDKKSLVLFSGGLDSYLSLLIALEAGNPTTILFFHYGQNSYPTERESVLRIAGSKSVPVVELNLQHLGNIFTSPYTAGINPVEGEAYNSSVPNRNMLFLTIASSYAEVNGFTDIYTGFYYENYTRKSVIHDKIEEMKEVHILEQPDQSPEFLQGFKDLLKLSSPDADVTIQNCLETFDKADIFDELNNRGELQFAIDATISCYATSSLLEKHDWGRGCGHCGSCITRRDAYNLMKTF